MATKTEPGKSLARVEAKNYAIQQFDEAQLRETVEINLGGENGISEFDLVRAKVPSGGGVAWNVEGPDGESGPQELVGVIVAHQSRRSFWYKGIDEGESGPPDCWSPDGIVGVGEVAKSVGGQCARCPKSQFGSAKGKDGKPAKGQACSQKKALFLLPEDSILPMYVSLPPTSLAAFKQYLIGLIGKRLPVTGVVTKITLAKQKNAGGTAYAEAKFEVVGTLDADATKKFTEFGKMFDGMFRPSIPGASEVSKPVAATVNGVEVVDRETGEVKE